MKTALITSILLLLTNYSSSQISRAFNQNDYSQYRTNVVSVVNGQMYYFSTKSSGLDSLVITSTLIDEFGETSNYTDYVFPGEFSGYNYRISGQALNNQGEIIFCIQALQSSTTSEISYIRIDPETGQVNEKYTLPYLFYGNFIQSKQKEDYMISYTSLSGGDFQRISMSLDGFLGYNLEYVGTSTTSQSGISGARGVDLLIVNNEEFVVANSMLYKRESSGNYLSINLSLGVTNITGVSLCQNNQNQIAVFAGNNYAHLSNDLSLLSSGKISDLDNSSGRISSLYYSNGKYIYYQSISSMSINDKVIINDSFEVDTIYKNKFYGDYLLSSALSIGNKMFFAGSVGLVTKNHSLLVESNGILPDTPLIEYDQVFKHKGIEAHTNHLGIHFSNQMLVAGFRILDDGEYKGVGFSGSNSIVGKSISSDTIGYNLNYVYDSMSVGPFVNNINRTKDFLDKYNRGYYVSSDMINYHALNYTSPGYIMPFGIREWPGNGNISNGEPNQVLPFKDINSNGIYEPEQGDFPLIYGDKCIVNVYHQIDEQNSAGIECHEYIYSFNCNSNDVMNNTVFINHHYFLRESILSEAYIGTFIDSDIGGPSDDYVGTNVELGMVYAYNGDQYDEYSSGAFGFLENPPAFGVQTLLGAKLASDGQDNAIGVGVNQSINGFGFQDGIIDNEFYTTESSKLGVYSGVTSPNSGLMAQSYLYFQGKLPDGTYLEINGVDTRFEYFGTSDSQFYASFGADHGNNWSEETAGNSKGDRRMYSGTGPIDIYPGAVDTVKLVTAYIVAHDSIDPSFDEVQMLFNYGTQLKFQFKENNADCNKTFDFYQLPADLSLNEEKLEAIVYPNPMTNTMFVSVKDNTINSLKIISLEGKEMLSESSFNSTVEINVSHLNRGIYILLINTDKGIVTKKITKI